MKRLLLSFALPVCLAAPGVQDVYERVDGLITAGRRLLDDDRPVEAEVLFAEASMLDGDSLHTRMWVLRAWMDQGRSNDTLDALDQLRSRHAGPEMKYLYGMAFARRAEGHLAAGVTDSSITLNFRDATANLRPAVEADPETFRDAFQPLASAAWYTQDLELARWAADHAVAAYPFDAEAWLTLGRVAMSQFSVAEKEASDAAEVHWYTANRALNRTLFFVGGHRAADRALLSDAAVQLGHALVWKGRRVEAADTYALALAASPGAVDYGTIQRLLTGPRAGDEGAAAHAHFNHALEAASARFRAMNGADDPRDAPLLWWLGWSRFMLGRKEESQGAFLDAVAKAPHFVNSWFYVAQARYDAGDWEGVVAALTNGWEAAPSVIVAEVQAAAELNVEQLDYVIGRIYARGDLDGSILLAEICAETARDDPRLWNNLGHFLIAEADRLAETVDPDADVLSDLSERAYVAYGRALRLAPEDPQLLNDTAAILHHYLDRDLELALSMYERAGVLAEGRLAHESLSEGDRARFEKAREGAGKNLELLTELLAERAAEAAGPVEGEGTG